MFRSNFEKQIPKNKINALELILLQNMLINFKSKKYQGFNTFKNQKTLNTYSFFIYFIIN
jgi:hypothetical protein